MGSIESACSLLHRGLLVRLTGSEGEESTVTAQESQVTQWLPGPRRRKPQIKTQCQSKGKGLEAHGSHPRESALEGEKLGLTSKARAKTELFPHGDTSLFFPSMPSKKQPTDSCHAQPGGLPHLSLQPTVSHLCVSNLLEGSVFIRLTCRD